MSRSPLVLTERREPLLIISINRAEARNAVNGPAAAALAEAFRTFEADHTLKVAILTGIGGQFCAGADLKAVASGVAADVNRISSDGDGPMGPSRMHLTKPVIAAISGYCVAGGLELALWCDLRIADTTAVFGVFCRRFGVPLIDGGTVRLPRLIGMSRALDLILTGRPVAAGEALQIGLANRVVPAGEALVAAEQLAAEIACFPQTCLRGDRQSVYQQWGMEEADAMRNELSHGMKALQCGESQAGANQFSHGIGRHGQF